jgi:hypothetical protein
MNVQGPTPAVFRPLVAGTAPGAGPAAGAPANASAPSARPAAAAEKTLWDVLTDEERAFFTQQAQLGTVTYGPARAAAPAPAAPMGRRIDVRG